MRTKKNPKHRLENYSKIFMQIGLVFSLFVVYSLMEHKTYESFDKQLLGVANMVDEMKEDIPIVEIQKVEPPKNVPQTVEVVKVVEDDLKVEETIIESTETDETEAVIVEERDIVTVEEEEEIVEDIPFVLIQDVPVFPGCKGNNEQLKKCFTKKVTEHFSKRFDVGLASELGLSVGKKRLYVVFTICKKGTVKNVRSRGPHPRLEKEVAEIIASLPNMTPGKQRGVPVGVSYSIPITFDVVQ
ncbi:MAG: energy transducer TonB [Flavobacteriaceae bacterium]|nr:energy transducer TonB [Flavobacteriaceae bacterium]|tara:strand:- start:572359 stop:573087 length:729 start_codon:yes stop_codon:yes gene_type:complete